jgi:hypothetical protein
LPEIILAPPGTQVIFRNDDRRPVTLASTLAPQLFPSTALPPGAKLAVMPPGPGQFDLHSSEYSHLRGTLLVPEGWSKRIDWSSVGEIGEARFDVPEGPYRARLFFLHRFVAEKDFTVTAPEKAPPLGGKPAGPATAPPLEPEAFEIELQASWPPLPFGAAASGAGR